ncbi:Reverse transcriptase domain [Trinorchestia longiramus]|nr:Reverse transcriptase domain [Trinorchestia longiramus]
MTSLVDWYHQLGRLASPAWSTDLVHLDFQKAFDKVPHERLMANVEAHGIRGNYSRWIRNWLTSRTRRVVIHDQASDSTLVTSGVPQGRVLGPLLFIYINDLDVGIISKINKFADDTKLCHRAFTERDKVTIQSDLNRLLQWTETWQMSFNIEKCSVIHVGANNRHFQHTMYDIPIETVQQQRDLAYYSRVQIFMTTTTSNRTTSTSTTPEPFLVHTNMEPTHDAVAHNQLSLLNRHPSRKPRHPREGANY